MKKFLFVDFSFLSRMKNVNPKDRFFIDDFSCHFLTDRGLLLFVDSHGYYWVSVFSNLVSGPYTSDELCEAIHDYML